MFQRSSWIEYRNKQFVGQTFLSADRGDFPVAKNEPRTGKSFEPADRNVALEHRICFHLHSPQGAYVFPLLLFRNLYALTRGTQFCLTV
jgi:hypothetical protein